MKVIRFSIIIPVYNSKDYIKECIESLQRQSFQNFEVIFVNDGSTDGSGDLCENIAETINEIPIRVFHQENSGQIEARYHGIRNAYGEYCCFLDSDDTLTSNALEEISMVVDTYSSDAIIFNGQRCLNGDSFPFWPEYNSEVTFYSGDGIKRIKKDLIFTRRLNNLAFKAIRTSILKSSIIYNNVTFIREEEDLMMQLPIFDKVESVVYIPKVLYNYRLNPTSVTGRYNPSRFPAKAYVLNERLKYSIKWGFRGFEIIRINLLVQSIKRTVFLLRNIVKDNSQLVISELSSIATSEEFYEIYNNRKNIDCDLMTRILIKLLNIKSYWLIFFIILLLRIFFGSDKQVNTVLSRSYFSETLNG